MPRRTASFLVLLALVLPAGVASANTSHAGWPEITGDLLMHKADQNGALVPPVPRLHNELLGGHGDDVLRAGDAGDVLWGDYKPSGQPTTQHDQIFGGKGKDYIYASHGRNDIVTGGGPDQVHAHFGHGSITCTDARPTIFLSHRSRKGYRLIGCTHISFKTLGY